MCARRGPDKTRKSNCPSGRIFIEFDVGKFCENIG